MGVLEPGWILETKPEQTIDANMGGPDQAIGQQPEVLAKDRKRDEKQRSHQRVEQIIDGGAEAYSQQVA